MLKILMFASTITFQQYNAYKLYCSWA